MAPAPLEIRLLGGFAVSVDGRSVPEAAWRLRRGKSLIKLLALAPDMRLHREQVAETLWPDREPASAANNLRQVVFVARRALDAIAPSGSHALTLRDDVFALGDEREVLTDVARFDAAAAAARERPSLDACRGAIELYAGDLLPEDRYEEWTRAQRTALRETYLGLLLQLAALHSAAGDETLAIDVLQRAVVEAPLHEAAQRALMRLYVADGRQQSALEQYQQLRRTLRRELAADPDPDTRALYREILAGSVEAGLEPPGAELPAATAAPSGPGYATNLPHQMTSFVGRSRELDQLTHLIERTRLLTLTGPGGCGKTRLALELARGLTHRFPDGVRLTELAALTDPELVAQEVAADLGLQLRSERDPVEVLGDLIGDAELLLVLDNCEHLIGACARLVERLLRVCPHLTVLATSREPLQIIGEVSWRVPSLTLPTPTQRAGDGLRAAAAVRLFCERAEDAAPGFELTPENAEAVATICVRLDGMPLALELAAARVAVLAPAQIAERLGDSLALLTAGRRTGLTRQATLRGTLEWSHELLSEDERTLFRRLGVFAGTFAIEAVEGTCGGEGIEPGSVITTVSRLVDRSLVQVEPGAGSYRYRLLETVRQFARELLMASGETARLEARHRDWYLALAESQDATATGESGEPELLEPYHEDLRAALASGLADDPPMALRLALAIGWFWLRRGYFAEGGRWMDAVLARNPERTEERARALLAAAVLEMRRGLTDRRSALAEECVAIRRDLGDVAATGRGLQFIGDLTGLLHGEVDTARRAYDEAARLALEADEGAGVASAMAGHALLSYVEADSARAEAELAEAARLLEQVPGSRGPVVWAVTVPLAVVPEGPAGAERAYFENTYYDARHVTGPVAAAYAACNIGIVQRTRGHLEAAEKTLDDALGRFRSLGDTRGIGLALHALGNLARTSGALHIGREYLEEAYAVRVTVGDRRDIGLTVSSLGLLAARAGEREEAWNHLDFAKQMFRRSEDGPGLAGIYMNGGCVALDSGDPELACQEFANSVVMWRDQVTIWHVGWAAIQLAEAAAASGDRARAAHSLAEARAAFERVHDACGIRRADVVERELELC